MFVCTDSLWCQLPISGDKNSLLFLIQEGQRALPESGASQLPSAQSNEHASEAYLGGGIYWSPPVSFTPAL